MSDRSILVVGGGIGGLATAIALRADAGRDVTVIEKQADMDSSVFGVGIIQPANAMRALDAIGCAEACLGDGYGANNGARSATSTATRSMTSPARRIEGAATRR